VTARGPDGLQYSGHVTHVQGATAHVVWGNGQQAWVAANQLTPIAPAKAKRNTAGCGFAVATFFVVLLGAATLAIGGQSVESETMLVYAGLAGVLGLAALAKRATPRTAR
jgi:hypothetical protein